MIIKDYDKNSHGDLFYSNSELFVLDELGNIVTEPNKIKSGNYKLERYPGYIALILQEEIEDEPYSIYSLPGFHRESTGLHWNRSLQDRDIKKEIRDEIEV